MDRSREWWLLTLPHLWNWSYSSNFIILAAQLVVAVQPPPLRVPKILRLTTFHYQVKVAFSNQLVLYWCYQILINDFCTLWHTIHNSLFIKNDIACQMRWYFLILLPLYFYYLFYGIKSWCWLWLVLANPMEIYCKVFDVLKLK